MDKEKYNKIVRKEYSEFNMMRKYQDVDTLQEDKINFIMDVINKAKGLNYELPFLNDERFIEIASFATDTFEAKNMFLEDVDNEIKNLEENKDTDVSNFDYYLEDLKHFRKEILDSANKYSLNINEQKVMETIMDSKDFNPKKIYSLFKDAENSYYKLNNEVSKESSIKAAEEKYGGWNYEEYEDLEHFDCDYGSMLVTVEKRKDASTLSLSPYYDVYICVDDEEDNEIQVTGMNINLPIREDKIKEFYEKTGYAKDNELVFDPEEENSEGEER